MPADRRPVWPGVLVCAIGTLAFFWPLLRGFTFSVVAGHQRWVYPWVSVANPYSDANQSDQATLSYPWQAFLARSVRAGDPPLWNPLSFGGQPFFSNGSSGTLYPPRLLAAFLLSPSAAHDFLSVLHVFGGGLAMFLLCRELGRRTAGSLLGATAWMFASFNMVWLHLEVVAPVVLLLPLSLLLVRRAVMGGGARTMVAAALVSGLTLVSGHLLILGAVWAIAAAYGAWCAIASATRAAAGGRERARAALRLAAVLVGGVGLFAFVLLPTAATIASSHRAPMDYGQFREYARSPPSVLLNVFRAPPVAALYDDNPMNRQMTFVGTAAGLLAVIGLFARGAAPALGRALALAVALLVLGTPVLAVACALVPGFTLLKPLGRLFFAWDLAVALLAAAGLDAAMARAEARWRQRTLLSLLALGIVTVNTVELVRYGRAVNPPFHPRTAELLYPVTPLITAGQASASRSGGRIVSVESWAAVSAVPPLCLVAGQHLVFGLPALGGYDSVVPERALHVSLVASGARTVEQVLQGVPRGAYRASFRTDITRFDVLPRLGVTTIVGPPAMDGTPPWSRTRPLRLAPTYSESDGQAFTIPDAPGRAWIAERAVVVDTPHDALRKLVDPAFDYRREVVLLRAHAPGDAQAVEADGRGAIPGEARITAASNNRLVVETRSEGAGWLVVADTWDPGWTATIDGVSAATLAGNYAFRAVRLPPGEHRVAMRYRPVRFGAGLAISVTTLLVGFALVALYPRRSPPRASAAASAASNGRGA